MKTKIKHLGLVTKKFNDFLVDIKIKKTLEIVRDFYEVRKSINFKDQLIYVGDEVVIENIDSRSKRAVIGSLKKEKIY